jgi:hypothetical protein
MPTYPDYNVKALEGRTIVEADVTEVQDFGVGRDGDCDILVLRFDDGTRLSVRSQDYESYRSWLVFQEDRA